MIIPVILSGGVGSRLWPLSRKTHPKPFILLQDGHSLLQGAFMRGVRLPEVREVITVTNRDLLFKTRAQYRMLDGWDRDRIGSHFILEPCRRNTASAIAVACLWIANTYGNDAMLLVLPADHLITNEPAFAAAVDKAAAIAVDQKLVTFGIQPSSAETAYGYIEFAGSDVLQFVEKPTIEEATDYLHSKRFLWNSGMLCCTASAMLAEMRIHCADILNACEQCMASASVVKSSDGFETEIDPCEYASVRSDSIDYAVMEKTRNAAIVACDLGWNDVGNWITLGDLQSPDTKGNRIQGDVIVHDSSGCTIRATTRVVAAIGLKNTVIVDTPDALLVLNKAEEQKVRQVYATLEERRHETHEYHRTVERPWGRYTVLDTGTGFKVKRLELSPDGGISLQRHEHRSEHWTVVQGVATVTRGENVFTLQVNESTHIERRQKHCLQNRGDTLLIVIEVQAGDYLGEDDIIRYSASGPAH